MAGFPEDKLLVGIGQVSENLDELKKSYMTACEAALCCMLPGGEQITAYSQMLSKKPLNIRIDEYESELIMNVSSGNASKVTQILDGLLNKVLNNSEISMESIRQLVRNLCHILIKLNVEFEGDIHNFLNKIGIPGYFLKYESIHSLVQVVYNFYNFAVQKYLDETGGKNSVVTKVKSFIERSYSEDIGLNKLSDLFHINASYLTRIFKEEAGYSINEYIVKVRVENAKRILEAGKVNIQKLAETVGYEDSTYFFKVFKKVTGMTPREYSVKNSKR
jgi:two-component system response regulator YesN